MNIIEALKSENIRVSNGRRWLVWGDAEKAWVVYGQEYAQKHARTIVVTEDEGKAIAYLLYEDRIYED